MHLRGIKLMRFYERIPSWVNKLYFQKYELRQYNVSLSMNSFRKRYGLMSKRYKFCVEFTLVLISVFSFHRNSEVQLCLGPVRTLAEDSSTNLKYKTSNLENKVEALQMRCTTHSLYKQDHLSTSGILCMIISHLLLPQEI